MERDPYNTYIEHRGRLYRYDPDMDCFYPAHNDRMTSLESWSPVIVLVILSAIAVYRVLALMYQPIPLDPVLAEIIIELLKATP
jgi:hypothetical protein